MADVNVLISTLSKGGNFIGYTGTVRTKKIHGKNRLSNICRPVLS